jgi:xanthine dehydrogenase accessory factor
VALATHLHAPTVGSIVIDADGINGSVPAEVAQSALELLGRGRSASALETTAEGRFLLEATLPIPRLLVVGTAALAGDLVHLAGWLGWSAEQFADADLAAGAAEALLPCDALVVFDHGLTRSGPLLAAALRSRAGYVGALGSRRTQARRAEHLRDLGVEEEFLARLHGPTGLDLGAANRAEIAMSICAEITAERSHHSARPLRETDGRIQS